MACKKMHYKENYDGMSITRANDKETPNRKKMQKKPCLSEHYDSIPVCIFCIDCLSIGSVRRPSVLCGGKQVKTALSYQNH